MLKLKKQKGNTSYNVYWENDVLMGEFSIMEDGYYVYWADPYRRGYMPAYTLRAIADKLDELNEGWDKVIQSDPAINK